MVTDTFETHKTTLDQSVSGKAPKEKKNNPKPHKKNDGEGGINVDIEWAAVIKSAKKNLLLDDGHVSFNGVFLSFFLKTQESRDQKARGSHQRSHSREK